MKNLIFLFMMVGFMVSCIPVPACDVGSYCVSVITATDLDQNVASDIIEFIDADVVKELGEYTALCRIYEPGPVYYHAGIKLEDIDSGWIAGVLAVVLGLIAIPWLLISKAANKIGALSETIAKGAYTGASMLSDFKLNSASTIVKEGAEIIDELGDVATILGNVTADGKFNAEDAKLVLQEGKDVIVALKDFIFVVKPKVPAV
jgi:hypothetical protein